jgi:hypothetical protein
MVDTPEDGMPDELDDVEVRERLRQLRRRAMADQINRIAMQPLEQGQPGHDVTPVIDAFGRGPSSPFYVPDYRPPWAPDWQPRPLDGGPPMDDDDGIEWRRG